MKRIKYIAQIQQTECGLCVITMLLNYYGAHYSLYDVRRLVDVGRDGMSVTEVFGTLEGFGIHAEAFRCKDVRDLRQLKTPFILALKKKHLVIVEKISKHAVYTVDPAVGRVKYSFEELLTAFDGICIEAVPGIGFQKKRNEQRKRAQSAPVFQKQVHQKRRCKRAGEQ